MWTLLKLFSKGTISTEGVRNINARLKITDNDGLKPFRLGFHRTARTQNSLKSLYRLSPSLSVIFNFARLYLPVFQLILSAYYFLRMFWIFCDVLLRCSNTTNVEHISNGILIKLKPVQLCWTSGNEYDEHFFHHWFFFVQLNYYVTLTTLEF